MDHRLGLRRLARRHSLRYLDALFCNFDGSRFWRNVWHLEAFIIYSVIRSWRLSALRSDLFLAGEASGGHTL